MQEMRAMNGESCDASQRFGCCLRPDEGNSRNADSPPLVTALSIHNSYLLHRSQVFLILYHHTILHFTSLHFTCITVHHATPQHNTPHVTHPTSFHLHYSAPHHTTLLYTSYTQNILRHHSLSNLSIIINFKSLHLGSTFN